MQCDIVSIAESKREPIPVAFHIRDPYENGLFPADQVLRRNMSGFEGIRAAQTTSPREPRNLFVT